MSRFRYVFSHGAYELASLSEDGGGAEFIFPKETRGELIIGGHAYPLSAGVASIGLCGFADGVYTPTLASGERRLTLPSIRKSGNRISFVGYSASEICERFDELRRLKKLCRELSEKYKSLEEYVFGKGIF